MPPNRPLLIDLDDEAQQTPSDAPQIVDIDLPQARAMEAALGLAVARPSRLVRFALWAVSTLIGFAISVAAYDFVTALLARSPILGGIAFALTAFSIVALLALALREAMGFWRLSRLDTLRAEAETARLSPDVARARAVLSHLTGLYAGRADLRWGAARLAERQAEVMDGDALLNLTETELLAPLDEAARREIESAARRVAMATALVPLALADVAVALFSNLRMIRAIATLYGGRAGTFGSLKLLRRVFGHLLATGALALGDDLISSVAGGGILGKLSRRFGEGVVNGALTARVGIAAMELCRPMPFAALPRPKVSNLIGRALTGVFDRDQAAPEPR